VIQAQTEFDILDANIKKFHDEYEEASRLFAECDPDAPDSKCTLIDQSILSEAMK